MKISIITAAYNSEKTIGEAIESVAMQSYPDIEHIIVDGLSKDSTMKIVEDMKHPRMLVQSEKDTGIYDAFNKGIRMATGDIIGFIGSDDYYPHKDVIAHIANAFNKNPTDSLYGDMQYINSGRKITRFWRGGEYNIANFLSGWMPHHMTCFIKRDIYLKYGLYLPDFKIGGDYELLLRMFYKHRISTQYLPEVIVTMRTGGASTKNISNRIKANMEDRRAWTVNGLHPRFYTLFFKPLLKIPQFFTRPA